MSIYFRATVQCDGCGASIHGATEQKPSRLAEAIRGARSKSLKASWATFRQGAESHYCPRCAGPKVDT